MPDRDKVHNNLPWVYQKPYKRLCEGQQPSKIARSCEKALKKRIQHFGDSPIKFLHQASNLMRSQLPGPLFDSDERVQKTIERLDQMAHSEVDNPRAASAALEACRLALSSNRPSGDSASHPADAVYRNYVESLFQKEWSGPVRNKPKQHPGQDHESVCDRIDAVVAEMNEAFANFGRQLARGNEVDNLRISRNASDGVDLHESLFDQ